MSDFDSTVVSFNGKARTLLTSKEGGRPVILLHELPGLTTKLIDFARMLVAEGFKLYLPVLFGSAEPKDGKWSEAVRGVQFLCVAREFRAFTANESGPWTDWLRQLLAKVCAEQRVKGAGVIGLCLTGNFALSMAADPLVLAPVMSEPSLPFVPKDGLHCSVDELKAVERRIREEGLEIRGYRYETDKICQAARFERLRAELGAGFVGTAIPATKTLHSVFTGDLLDEHGVARHDKVREVVEFLRGRLPERVDAAGA